MGREWFVEKTVKEWGAFIPLVWEIEVNELNASLSHSLAVRPMGLGIQE